jgi:hypothetical protein
MSRVHRLPRTLDFDFGLAGTGFPASISFRVVVLGLVV